MTAPIQEPTAFRTTSGLGAGQRQLFRRPAPAGSGDLPWARISKGFDASNQAILNNTNSDLTFNHDYNMGAGESGENFFATSGTTGLTALVHGLYLCTAEVFWFDSITTTWMLAITNTDAWFHGNYFAGQNNQDLFGQVTVPIRIDPNMTYFATVWQISTGTRNVDAFYLEMVYLGEYTGTERAAMNPDQ